MGQCMAVGQHGPLPAELQEATRKYFGLGELPVTLNAESRRQALIVKVVGLDHDNLLLALEAGFHARRYWIKEGAININRGLFLGTFELVPRRKSDQEEDGAATMEHAKRAMAESAGEVRVVQLQSPSADDDLKRSTTNGEGTLNDLAMVRTATRPNVGDGTPTTATSANLQGSKKSLLVASGGLETTGSSAKQLAKADDSATRRGASVRLTIVREWAPGLRVALRQTILASGLKIVSARLSVSESTSRRTVKDTFWLAAINKEAEEGARDLAAKSVPMGPTRTARSGAPSTVASTADMSDAPDWLVNLSTSLTEVQPTCTPADTWVSDASGPLPDGQNFERVVSEGVLGESNLPEALHHKTVALNYRVRLDLQWGLQFDGVDKYTGAGMNIAHSGKHVLEFSTFYLKKPADEVKATPRASSWGASFAALTGQQREQAVAEFITEYHPDSRCLTIFKVFLNDVLPAGKRAGARATAEQLPCMKVPGSDKWDGVAALKELKHVHLCDCVNWNTYCLMSKVGKAPEDDIEKWLLEEEAKASGFTLADVRNKSVLEIFPKTALGRLVYGVLKIWKEEYSVQHKVESVSVEWNRGEHELICGEYRAVMDIYVQLQVPPD